MTQLAPMSAAAPAIPPRNIRVERDVEGVRDAIRWLYEESLALHRMRSAMHLADPETLARLEAELPPRELSPGYFKRAVYLLDLATQIELGIALTQAEVTREDVLGLQAVKRAWSEFQRDHPSCPACGERQDNRYLKECFNCHTKFAGRGN